MGDGSSALCEGKMRLMIIFPILPYVNIFPILSICDLTLEVILHDFGRAGYPSPSKHLDKLVNAL